MKTNRIRFYYGVLRGTLSHIVRGYLPRTETNVLAEYGGNYAREEDSAFFRKQKLVYERGKPRFLSVAGYKRALLRRFADELNSRRVENVLELGCGRGANLLALAVLCPHLRRAEGIELTAEGVARARQNFTTPPIAILEELTGEQGEKICERLGAVSFDVIQGSIASRLPFSDSSFDAVFSNSVIEQIPKEYPKVFSECFRVARSVGIWSEPFAEAQGLNIFYRLYLKNIDYFRASYKEVLNSGWKFISFVVPDIQKKMFKTGFLVCERR